MADDRILLEGFTRPENLIEHHIKQVVEFETEHRKRLCEIADAVNPEVGGVGDSTADPIVLTCHPTDRVEFVDLCETGDAAFSKVIATLSILCDEANYLKQVAKEEYYTQLSLFGHTREDDNAEFSDGVLEAMMGNCMSKFQDCANFCGRCNMLVVSIVQQISALYGKDSAFRGTFLEVKFRPLTLALGDILTVLITIDTIVRSNKLISTAWEKYKKMADVMKMDPAKYGADPAKAPAFEKLLADLDSGIMTGHTLRACFDQTFDPLQFDPTGVCVEIIRERAFDNIDFLLNNVGTEVETTEKLQIVGQFGLYALYRAMTSRYQPDKRHFERLWKVQERMPMVVLHTKYVWLIDEFLVEYASIHGLDLRKLSPRDPAALREQAASEMVESFPAFAALLHTRVCAWNLQAIEAFAPTPLDSTKPVAPADLVRRRAQLVSQAVCLAHLASRQLGMFLNYHLVQKRDFKKKCIDPVAKCLEVLKVLEAAVKRFNIGIVETYQHIQRDTVVEIWELSRRIRLHVTTSRTLTEGQPKIVAACDLIERLITSTESWVQGRRTILELCLSVGQQKAGISKDTDIALVARSTWLLGLMAEYHNHMRQACDTSMMYWVRELLPALTACACTVDGHGPGDIDSRQGSRVQFLYTAFSDAARMLNLAIHLPPPPPAVTRLALAANSQTIRPTINPESAFAGIDHLLSAYEVYLHSILHHHVVLPLCRAVETDLRVHVHAVRLEHMEPPNLKGGKPPLVHLLYLPPIRLFSSLVDIRQEVTFYLEKTFYELTTVALHDWKTYGEMASVAADKYGLNITDNHLPMGCLDSGLDILRIMRNIHVFVARFNYNIHQQFFVEKKSAKGGKHLNTVTIDSISASIRQHGTGMMNTTVNFAYQYLSQKFFIFSQFLYDEYIKSYLMKERRFFRKERKALGNRYPYEHAIELNRDIRKLGMTDDKLFYLDKFRQLITEIGNALGYVRMVRTAGMHAAAEAVKFVPDLGEMISFEEAAKQVLSQAPSAEGADAAPAGASHGLSAGTLEAAAMLDAVLKNLTGSFAEGVDYFQVLVSVFQHSLLDKKPKPSAPAEPAPVSADGTVDGDSKKKKEKEDSHLRNFFLIIPALTLNFIDSLRTAKDRMDKGVKGMEAFFSDDGFAIGIAYILAILKQDRVFESLHWWDSVKRFHEMETQKLTEELAKLGKSKADSDRRDELEFKIRKLGIEGREMRSLFFAYRGARNFFRQDDEDDDDDAIAAQL